MRAKLLAELFLGLPLLACFIFVMCVAEAAFEFCDEIRESWRAWKHEWKEATVDRKADSNG